MAYGNCTRGGGRPSPETSGDIGGILAILSMLVEDTEKELAEGRSDNADAQDKYLKQNGALQVPHFVRCKISQQS